MSMLQWPRNRHERAVFIRRLLALLVLSVAGLGLCGLCLVNSLRGLT